MTRQSRHKETLREPLLDRGGTEKVDELTGAGTESWGKGVEVSVEVVRLRTKCTLVMGRYRPKGSRRLIGGVEVGVESGGKGTWGCVSKVPDLDGRTPNLSLKKTGCVYGILNV